VALAGLGFIILVLGGSMIEYYKEWKISRVKKEANRLSGDISDQMRRVVIEPRKGWEEKVRLDGLTYWDLEGIKWIKDYPCNTYWNEEGCIIISAKAEKEVMEATFKLHNMCLEVVDRVVKDDVLLTLFEIP